MSQRVRAVYRDGAFVPQTPLCLPENIEVDLFVESPLILPPEVTEPDERAQVLSEIIARMQQNPIPAEAPPLTREDLHERR